MDVGFVIDRLHMHTNKWREIGLSLDFQHAELEGIRQSSPAATTQQLLSIVLSQWAQWPMADHPNVPTMEKLCDALRSGLVGLGALANDLYKLRTCIPSRNLPRYISS